MISFYFPVTNSSAGRFFLVVSVHKITVTPIAYISDDADNIEDQL